MLVFLNLGPMPFQLYTYNFPDNAICDISIYADHTILSSKSDEAFDLQHQLQLTSELEFDLQQTSELGSKWLVDFNVGKTQLV